MENVKYYEQAYYARVAAQAVMTEAYATNQTFDGGTNSGDVDWTNQNNTWGNKVLSLMDCTRGDNEPYILIFGVGQGDLSHTVLFIGYVADNNAPAVFYVDGAWTYNYPWNDGTMAGGSGKPNRIGIGPNKGEVITLYVVSNRTGVSINSAGFWTGNGGLRAHSDSR